jgi:hypothetical protein
MDLCILVDGSHLEHFLYTKLYQIKLQRTCYHIIKKVVKSLELYKKYLTDDP